MPKEPLYPHRPKRKEPLFPHVPKGQRVERLPQTREGIKNFWVEQNPEGTWAVVEAFPGGTVRSPFKTKEEAIKQEQDIGHYYEWRLKQVPSPQEKFPRQHEALKRLYPYIIAEYHDDGDLTVRELIPVKGRPGFDLGKLYVVTTDGQVFEETKLAMTLLPKTAGDPLSKYCCRICGKCAPKELLGEGKFLERISWLRHHYKERHPGMWGKGGTMPQTEYYWTAINKGTGEIVEYDKTYATPDKALSSGRDWATKHWKGDTALVEVWRQPYRYSENLKIQSVEKLTLGGSHA